MRSVYLIGSLRNSDLPKLAQQIRNAGFEVFDSWYAAGPTADDSWQAYETTKGLTYPEALRDYAARHVYAFDKHHLDRCDGAVLAMPAGKSAHLELGYILGLGKPGYVIFDKEPERWDVMYQFANGVFYSPDDLIDAMKEAA